MKSFNSALLKRLAPHPSENPLLLGTMSVIYPRFNTISFYLYSTVQVDCLFFSDIITLR